MISSLIHCLLQNIGQFPHACEFPKLLSVIDFQFNSILNNNILFPKLILKLKKNVPQNLTAFLYINNEQRAFQIKNTISFTLTPSKINQE